MIHRCSNSFNNKQYHSTCSVQQTNHPATACATRGFRIFTSKLKHKPNHICSLEVSYFMCSKGMV